MFLSSLSVISSSSWLMLWVFMELNSLALCSSLLKENNQKKQAQASMMYLTVQISASIIFIISTMSASTYPILIIFSILSIFMKAGMWPTHLWYLKTLENMTMKSKAMKIMMTWQKLIPMIILIYLPLKNLILLISTINLVSPMAMLKKNTSLKPTLILSSMNNNTWFVLSIFSSITSFIMFFTMYSMSTIMSLSFFKNISTKMALLSKKTWQSLLVLANMGSIPPTGMFIVKCLIIMSMVMVIQSKELIVLILGMACLFTYFYMWATMNFLSKMTTKTQLTKEHSFSNQPWIILLIMVFSLFMLFLGLTF